MDKALDIALGHCAREPGHRGTVGGALVAGEAAQGGLPQPSSSPHSLFSLHTLLLTLW